MGNDHLLLLVHSYPGGNETVMRHYECWQRINPVRIVGIGTTDGGCLWPDWMEEVRIGENKYISGDHLPCRLVNTIAWAIEQADWDRCCIIEYDTIFLNSLAPLPEGLLVYHAGGTPPGATCTAFFHNPWIFDRQMGAHLVKCGRTMLGEGDWQGGSPDTFLGGMCDRFAIPWMSGLWSEYSRNTIDGDAGFIAEAREAVRNGVDVIHGIKSAETLRAILAP